MVNEIIKLVAFSLLPAAALFIGGVYSLYEIRRLGDQRLAVIVLVLGLMTVHQSQEILYFVQNEAFRDPVIGEIPETGVNIISAGGVYYLLAFARKQQELQKELKNSKEELVDVKRRLERIFENVNDGILLIDLDREAIIEANEPAHRLLRYDIGELVGRSPFDIHPHQPEQYELFADSVRTDGGVITEELSCRRGDGTTMPAAVSAARTTLDGTEMLLVTIRDNSEREQYRSQLNLFARVLRHNLRNDMTVIQGTLDHSKTFIDDESFEERIERAVEKCKQLTKMSDKTRKLNDIVESAQSIGTSTADLVPLTNDVVDEYRESHPNANIDVECPETAMVQASEQVRWALDNLVENAIVHAENTPEIRITIEKETTEEDGQTSEWITLTVTDKGPGIPSSEVSVINDETNRTATNHGSGLGLWIVKQITQAYHGRLDIDRNPETEFSTEISLRLQPTPNDDATLLSDRDAES
jgi:PAS domain S-box-containing protein